MTAVILTERLTKSHGSHRGIVELDLDVQENEVFGIETTADPVAIHRRTGYLPGELHLYDWQPPASRGSGSLPAASSGRRSRRV